MAVLVDEQVKELCHQALGRSKSSAASSILAHFPTIPEPTWAAGFLEALPVQYLLASLKELAVVVQHHPDIRQAVKEAGDLVRIEALKYIKLMPCENTDSDSPAGIMAMDCFLALGLHVPTFYPVAKGFLLDFQEEPQGALLILKGLNGEIFYLQFSFIMFRNVLNYFRHNRVQGLSP
ncbi:uncharacterized protein PFLUO_LOCUS8349 [Penicillium psychrofluorescens]|uniref:uncharacterized protein n=1 Tax=Penicillium psychrofluorescens TaxID=3158075 RepID=UPI003CCD1207